MHTKHQHTLQGTGVMTSYHRTSPHSHLNLCFTKVYTNLQTNIRPAQFLLLFSCTTIVLLFPSLYLCICSQRWERRAKTTVSKSTSQLGMLCRSCASHIFPTHTAVLQHETKCFPSKRDSSRKCQSFSQSPALTLEPFKRQREFNPFYNYHQITVTLKSSRSKAVTPL